ncbi:hypothetical protein ACHAQI_011381 [Fusarium lateritium]
MTAISSIETDFPKNSDEGDPNKNETDKPDKQVEGNNGRESEDCSKGGVSPDTTLKHLSRLLNTGAYFIPLPKESTDPVAAILIKDRISHACFVLVQAKSKFATVASTVDKLCAAVAKLNLQRSRSRRK